MSIARSGFDLFRSDRHWQCDCGEPIGRGEEYAVRLFDNEEVCMECYRDETKYGRREQ